MAELDAMELRWLKLMQPDQPALEHAYLLSQLQSRGIEPVLRVVKTYNDPYVHLEPLVRAGVAAGVDYYELYNNVNVAGLSGGWRSGAPIDVAALVTHWRQAAQAVRLAGGYPGLPTLSPWGAIDDDVFLRRFLQELIAQDSPAALDRAWLPIQNYMGNLPLGDPRGFQAFERYHRILQEETGRVLPILSTEGGALVGDRRDAGRPALDETTAAAQTAAAFRFMQEEAPDYYFALMPWLLVNSAAGGYNQGWEEDAWFPEGEEPRPVVAAVYGLRSSPPATPTPLSPAPTVQYAGGGQEAAEEDEGFRTAASPAQPLGGQESESRQSQAPMAARSQSVITREESRIVSSGQVTVTETTLDLPTYDTSSALIASLTGDPIYPAERLDFQRLGPVEVVSYRAILLENDFLRLTILPELGGRIYRWEDKASGRDILYHNPVVKPAPWGVRGWTLASGGMQWVYPLADYGLVEYKAWQADIIADTRSAAVTMGRTGPGRLAVEVMVALNADQRFFAVTATLQNRGTEVESAHLWSHASLAPGRENRVDPGSTVSWPADQVQIQRSEESQWILGATHDWPAGTVADLSRLANWPAALTLQAPQGAFHGAVGLVDPADELAVIRAFPHKLVPGLAAAYAPGRDTTLWTDDGSGPTFELMGGVAPSLNRPVTLQPDQSLRWTEQWYTVPGLGPFVAANAHAALAIQPTAAGSELRLAATGSSATRGNLRLVVRVDDEVVYQDRVTLAGSDLLRLSVPRFQTEGRWLVQLFDAHNRVLLAYDSRLEPPVQPVTDPPEWDERLDDLQVDIVPASVKPGQSYWRITRAEFQNLHEGGGRHHIFIEVLDENGDRMVGQEVEVFWPNGSATVVTEDKPAPEYAANFPMYGDLGGYRVRVPGLSDTITGLGLPGGRDHVVFNLIFQRTVKQ